MNLFHAPRPQRFALALAATLLGSLWLAGCYKVGGSSSSETRAPIDTSVNSTAPVPAAGPDRKAQREKDGEAGPYSSVTDEVWVIVKDREGRQAQPPKQDKDETPGSGAMVTLLPGETEHIPLPLKHTDVKAGVSGYIATVDVTQQFHNPYSQKIEAVYVFPLPQDAAVNDFVMIIGERRIRGIIREKEEAQRIYNQARAQGYRAALMTQQRPNIFTQKVANIEPGKQIDVKIRYFNTLHYADGWYEFIFPMVVGPRFNPSYAPDPIHAVPRGGVPAKGTAVSYLRPHERSGHDIALTLDIDAGVPIEEVVSVNHKVNINGQTKARYHMKSEHRAWDEVRTHTGPIDVAGVKPRKVSVAIDESDRIPNKDFVLRFRVAGEQIKTALMTWRNPDKPSDGYFTLMLYPPKDLDHLKRSPMEMIFVLDCSGSMSGTPMAQSKDAMRRALDRLEPGDSFQVIRFSNDASKLGPQPLAATADNIRQGKKYVDSLRGSGGTHMIEGIKAALDYHHDRDKLRFVCFLTDGYIGNERQILREMHQRIDQSRVFSFGVGSSTNRYLMQRMAKIGRGVSAYLSNNEDGGDVMDRFFDRISHPALTDLKINFRGMNVSEVYPKQLPDLFVGRPVVVTGRFSGHGKAQVVLSGRAADRDVEVGIHADLDAPDQDHAGIAPVWARLKIADLHDQYTITQSNEILPLIKDTALAYNLMSQYTAFVAVDSSQRTEGEFGVTVHQPVPVPDGVRYDTTIAE